MFVKKHKRRILSVVPLVFLVLISLVLSAVAFYYTTNAILSKKQNYISPLSTTKTGNIEGLLYEKNIPFSQVRDASESSKIIVLKDGGEVLVSSKKDMDSQISSLQLILSRLTIEGKKFKRLDLRFERVVIVF